METALFVTRYDYLLCARPFRITVITMIDHRSSIFTDSDHNGIIMDHGQTVTVMFVHPEELDLSTTNLTCQEQS